MSRKGSNLLDYGIEEEVDPKLKFNSLISVTISTVMCLAAKCPLPKSNVETTKLFLSTVTDENGKNPRNVKGFLSLLDDYTGPFDNSSRENRFEKPPVEKLTPEEKKPSLESIVVPKSSVLVKEVASTDGQALVKRRTSTLKKNERDPSKKGGRSMASTKISTSKSVICSKS